METKHIFLRSLELEDLDRVHKWHNNPALYEKLTNTFRYVSRLAEENWFRKMISYSTQDISLAICLMADCQHIGNFYLRDIDWIARNAKMGIFIGEPNERSKGYATEVLRLVINHAFKDLGLLKLYAHTFADNKPAIKHLEKCGAIQEGKLTKHCFKSGEFKDVLIMSIFTDKFTIKN